jgi:hypothetical protein
MFLNLDLLKPDVPLYVQYILKTDVPSNLMYKFNSKYIHAVPDTAAPYVCAQHSTLFAKLIYLNLNKFNKRFIVANIQDHIVKY